ncbi:MAG: hypothetical protein U0269_29400 [Polyangiales bacterium]
MLSRYGAGLLVRAAIAGALCLAASSASAQETCDEDAGTPPPDYGQLIETFPSNNAREIPRDGFVRFVYRGRVPPRPVMIVRDASEATVDGTLTVVGAELHWQSRAPLAAQQRYTATSSDIIGGSAQVAFTTSDAMTNGVGPSGFEGALSATSERSGATDICGDENARSVTVGWKFARSSPWPQTELTYIVFETRGPGINGPVERARDRGRLSTTPCAPNADQCVTFRLSSINSSGPACFSVQVFDPLGRSTSNTVEKCINLDAGNYFYGCAVRPTPTTVANDRSSQPSAFARVGAASVAVIAAVLLRARRRRAQ